MKRIGYAVLFYLAMMCGIAHAESGVTDKAKAVVNALRPTVEAVYDLHSNEWDTGTAGSLYNFRSQEIHLGRAKAGYLSSNAPYVGADIDLPGLVLRYAGGKWTELDTVLQTLSDYSAIGYIVGADVEAGDIVHGPSFGATLRF